MRKRFKFGVVSDTHIGGKESRLDYLHDAYKTMKKEDCELVLHTGDVIDGVGVYRGQHRRLKDHTIPDQCQRVINEYPTDLQTHFILGNHDMRHVDRSDGNGLNPGRAITKGFDYMDYPSGEPVKKEVEGRKDMHFLGEYNARIKLPEIDSVVELIHPDGFFYSKSYGIQKYFRDQPSRKPGITPDIALFGHRHQMLMVEQNGIYAFECGTFKDIDEFQARRGLFPALGYWTLDVVREGKEFDIYAHWKSYPNKPMPSYKIR